METREQFLTNLFMGFDWSCESFMIMCVINRLISLVVIRNVSANWIRRDLAAHRVTKRSLALRVFVSLHGWIETWRSKIFYFSPVKSNALRTVLISARWPSTFKNWFCWLSCLPARKTQMALSARQGRLRPSWRAKLSVAGRARVTHSFWWILWNFIICLEFRIVINFVLSFVAVFVLETFH